MSNPISTHYIFKSKRGQSKPCYFCLMWANKKWKGQFVLSLVFLLMHLPFSISLASVKDSSKLQTDISTKSNIALDKRVPFETLFQQSLSLLYNNPDSSRLIIQEVFALGLFENPAQKVRSINLLGATYHLQANYAKSLEYYYEALPIAIDLKDNKCIANIYNNIGSANLKIGYYKEALNSFLKANKIYRELELIELGASVLNNIGLLYMDINNFEKARFHFREAYLGFELEHDSIGMAAALSNIGTLFCRQRMYRFGFFLHQSCN